MILFTYENMKCYSHSNKYLNQKLQFFNNLLPLIVLQEEYMVLKRKEES